MYIDRRVTVNGRESIINLDNYLNLKDYINDAVTTTSSITLTSNAPGLITFNNSVDPPFTFKEGWTLITLDVNGDLVATYPEGTQVTIPIVTSISANNGLTKTGSNIKFGGALTEPTTISSSNYPLSFTHFGPTPNNLSTNISFINLGGSGIQAGLSDIFTGGSASFSVNPNNVIPTRPLNVTIAATETNVQNNGSAIVVTPLSARIRSHITTQTETQFIDVSQATIEISGHITLTDFDETRDDSSSHAPINFLYTDNNGLLLSAPLSDILIDAINSFTIDSSTIDFTVTTSPNSLTADVIPNTTVQKIEISKGGVLTGTRKGINFIQGSNVTLTATDDVVNDRVNLTIAATGGGGGGGLTDAYYSFTDGTTASTATTADTFKFRSANNILSVAVTDDDITHGDNLLLTVNQGNIDHNALLNYSVNQHIDHSTVTITAGSGLTGGGNITANLTIAHADTSSVPDTSNTAATFIQNLTFDTYGHVQAVSSATITPQTIGFPTPSSVGQIIYWTGSVWDKAIRIKNIQTATGFNNFNLPHTPLAALPIDVYINGVLKEETQDYTLSGNTLTFNYTFQTADKITTIYYI